MLLYFKLFVILKALMRLLAALLSAQRADYCAELKQIPMNRLGVIKQDRTDYQMLLGLLVRVLLRVSRGPN